MVIEYSIATQSLCSIADTISAVGAVAIVGVVAGGGVGVAVEDVGVGSAVHVATSNK